MDARLSISRVQRTEGHPAYKRDDEPHSDSPGALAPHPPACRHSPPSLQRRHQRTAGERTHPDRSLHPVDPVPRGRTVAVAVSDVTTRLQQEQIAKALLVAAVDQLQGSVRGDPDLQKFVAERASLLPGSTSADGRSGARRSRVPRRQARPSRGRERPPGSSPPHPGRDSDGARRAAPGRRAARAAAPAPHPEGPSR